MTRLEAEERAEDLWGDRWPGGPKDLTLHPSMTERGCWHIEVRREADRWLLDRHYLDSNGHSDCHESCVQREATLDVRKGYEG